MYGTSANNPGVRESLEAVARDFERAHAGLSVEPLFVTEAYYDKLQNLLVAGTPLEVFWLDVRSFPAYALRGDLASLEPLIKRGAYDIGDFYDRLVKQYVWRDAVRGLPWDMGFQAVFYNLDLFKAAGVAAPPGDWKAPGWTFADFTAAAQRLTADGAGGERAQYGFANATQPWFPWLYANGGRQVNEGDTEAMLHRPEASETYQFLRDLIHRHRVSPPPAEARQWPTVQSFMNGRAAMVVTAAATGTTSFRLIKEFAWDVAPMPRGPSLSGERRTHGGGSGWMQAARTPNPEEAWALMRHVTGKAVALALARVGWSPPRRSVGESTVWLDPALPPKSKAVYRDVINHIITNPRLLTRNELSAAADKELAAVWADQASPAAAAARMSQLTRPMVEEHVRQVAAAGK